LNVWALNEKRGKLLKNKFGSKKARHNMIEKDRKTQQPPFFTDTYDIAEAQYIAGTQGSDTEVTFLFRIQSGWNPAD
jgi:hypothetical protein